MWRRKTIQTVGGWQSRTTVEDMDLSLRAYVNGWKAIYLTDTTCSNEARAPAGAARGAPRPRCLVNGGGAPVQELGVRMGRRLCGVLPHAKRTGLRVLRGGRVRVGRCVRAFL